MVVYKLHIQSMRPLCDEPTNSPKKRTLSLNNIGFDHGLVWAKLDSETEITKSEDPQMTEDKFNIESRQNERTKILHQIRDNK